MHKDQTADQSGRAQRRGAEGKWVGSLKIGYYGVMDDRDSGRVPPNRLQRRRRGYRRLMPFAAKEHL